MTLSYYFAVIAFIKNDDYAALTLSYYFAVIAFIKSDGYAALTLSYYFAVIAFIKNDDYAALTLSYYIVVIALLSFILLSNVMAMVHLYSTWYIHIYSKRWVCCYDIV